MNTPNLFHFASSELSQDAFICWLLSWAKEEHAKDDKSLHECALRFIAALFEKHNLSMPDRINQIAIKKQHHKIDVFCVINKEYAIIIEDKTGSKNHSKQLVRYREKIKEDYSDEKILCIFYKTGDQGDCYKDVEERDGYKPFLRQDILKVLDRYTGNSEILLSYKAYLKTIVKEVKGYKTWPLAQWCWRSWMGFYLDLQSRLGEGTWDYVSNPSGGFIGFWWPWKGDEKCQQYLQLEQSYKESDARSGLLCFKIEVADESEYGTLRGQWHQAIMAQGENQNMLELDKPGRFGFGETMTVCVHKSDYRIVDEQNIIDMDKTLARLQSAMKVLDAAQGRAA